MSLYMLAPVCCLLKFLVGRSGVAYLGPGEILRIDHRWYVRLEDPAYIVSKDSIAYSDVA